MPIRAPNCKVAVKTLISSYKFSSRSSYHFSTQYTHTFIPNIVKLSKHTMWCAYVRACSVCIPPPECVHWCGVRYAHGIPSSGSPPSPGAAGTTTARGSPHRTYAHVEVTSVWTCTTVNSRRRSSCCCSSSRRSRRSSSWSRSSGGGGSKWNRNGGHSSWVKSSRWVIVCRSGSSNA